MVRAYMQKMTPEKKLQVRNVYTAISTLYHYTVDIKIYSQ